MAYGSIPSTYMSARVEPVVDRIEQFRGGLKACAQDDSVGPDGARFTAKEKNWVERRLDLLIRDNAGYEYLISAKLLPDPLDGLALPNQKDRAWMDGIRRKIATRCRPNLNRS